MSAASFGELRSLLQRPYTPDTWDELVALIDRWEPFDEAHLPWLDYIQAHIANWPPAVRYASPRWLDVTAQGSLLPIHPALRLATGLRFTHKGEHVEVILRALNDPSYAQLSALALSGAALGTTSALELLTHNPTLAHLRELSLDACQLTWEGVRALSHTPYLSQLRALSMASNRLGELAISQLVQSSHVHRLECLCLNHNLLGSRGVSELVGSSWSSTLRVLELGGCLIGAEGAHAIASSPHLGQLERLILRDNRMMAWSGIEALIMSASLRALRELDLSSCQLTDNQALSLARSPLVNRLAHLGLADNPISAQARAQLHDMLGARLCWDSEMG